MNEILDLIKELESLTPEKYGEVKPYILAQCEDNEHLHGLMQEIFRFVENKRPEMIGSENVA